MFTRNVNINQNLSLVVHYPTEIVEKDSILTVDFFTPYDSDEPSNMIQINHNLLSQIIHLCNVACQHEDMLVIDYHNLWYHIDVIAYKGN